MRRVIFLFLDGVGLGSDDPNINPLAAGHYPNLYQLMAGKMLVEATGRLSSKHAELVPTDACMGISGRPQSATGQASILTGINAAARLGEHYGPRPDDRVRAVIDEGNVFLRLRKATYATNFCNAYPRGYFDAVRRGKRLLSAIPYAASSSGQELHDAEDLFAREALAADFTARGWQRELGYQDAPVLDAKAAGRLLWQIAQPFAFTLFEHWWTDLLGHRQQLAAAVRNFEQFDRFLAGLWEACAGTPTLIMVGSDHGNVEDCGHGKHTLNPALTLLLGEGRQRAAERIRSLTDYVPVILDFLQVNNEPQLA